MSDSTVSLHKFLIKMRKLKLSFVVLATLVLGGVFFVGCSNDSSETDLSNSNALYKKSDNSDILPEYFDFIGEAHNSGLDYVYYNAVEQNYNLKYEDVRTASLFYFDNIYSLTLGQASSNYRENHDLIVKLSVESNSILPEGFDYSSFSEEEITFLTELDRIIDEETDLNTKIRKIDLLNTEIYNSDLEDNQLAKLYMTNSIAKNSLTYWGGESGKKWFITFPDDNSGNNPNPTYPVANAIDWENVAKADIAAFLLAFPAGAKAGAIKGAIVLGLASGGTGAVTGAIIGAIGGGAAAGISAAVAASGAVLAAEAIVSWW